MTTTRRATPQQQQSKTLVVTPIPCPGEDYDAAHTTVASLASLRAMAESYDAIMDSLMNTTSQRMAKLQDIESRAQHCRTLVKDVMKKIGDYGGAVTVSAPSSYERAIHSKKPLGADTTSDLQQTLAAAIDQARIVSNTAVLTALKKDSIQDDGMARPSDLWLDRVSGFDEHRACRNAERANSVPLLGRVYYRYRGDYYCTMEEEEANATNASKNGGGVSATPRKEAKKHEGPHIRRMDHADKTTFSGATSRQQAASGSTPYLCEVLHDAYGMGSIPPAGGEFYPEPTDVAELLVFNSSRKTYGDSSLLSVADGALKKKKNKKKKKKEIEVDLIDLSDKNHNEPIDLLSGSPPRKENNNNNKEEEDDEDKILSSDFTHPSRSKMFQMIVPSYRPETTSSSGNAATSSNAGKLELPTDLPLTDVVKVGLDDDDAGTSGKGGVDHLDNTDTGVKGGKEDGGKQSRGKKQLADAGEFV